MQNRPDRAGLRRVTLQEVADGANVSRATASLVVRNQGNLSDATRARVRGVMAELGYVYHRGAASLRSQRTHTVGIVVPTIDIDFLAELTTAFETALMQRDIVTMIAISAEDVEHQGVLIRSLIERQVDGLVVIPAVGSPRSLGQDLTDTGVPAVICTRGLGFGALPYVGIDNLRAGRVVAEHLVHHGSRRIAYIGGPEQVRPRRDRLRGLTTALANSSTGARVVVDLAGPAKGVWARDATLELLEAGPAPDAIVCHNDLVAFGVFRALRQHDRPGARQVCVISHDDIAAAALWEPPLTTVAARGTDVGTRCADVLMRLITGDGSVPSRTLVPPHLLVRESCGCPPQ